MPEQVKVRKPEQPERTKETISDDEVDAAKKRAIGHVATKEAVDKKKDLIDEIDDLLEENAEHFVNSYTQTGGQ